VALRSRFARYMNPVLAALKALGGSARPGEVCDWVAEHLRISDEERSIENLNGGSRFDNDIAWARFYLVRSGYLESSRRGVWSLTEQGRGAETLTDEEIKSLIRAANRAQNIRQAPLSGATESETTEAQIEQNVIEQAEQAAPEDVPRGYRERILEIMQSLPPQGFERLCQRLLRESDFQQVRVTGRSGDGGIDGIGILQVNTFVSFKVVFQCKRWSNAVGSPEVRNFRGAMMGRADKGLILTTGVFTADAQAEAVRDGVPPIELVDGQALVTLLERLELGLVPRTTYEVDERFFDEFGR
jgi:restriction system protein